MQGLSTPGQKEWLALLRRRQYSRQYIVHHNLFHPICGHLEPSCDQISSHKLERGASIVTIEQRLQGLYIPQLFSPLGHLGIKAKIVR